MARNTVNLLLGQVSTTALTIVLTAAVARSLGPSDFGVLYLMTSVATFAYVFVDWGHGAYVIREVARNEARAGELMGTVMSLRAATAAALIGPAVLVARLLGYDGRTQLGILVMMVAWVPMSLGLSYGWAFRGIERMEFDALINVVLKALWLVAGVTILMMGGRLLGVISAIGIAGSITLVVAAVIYRRLGLPRLRVSWTMARELMVGGAPIVTMTIAVALQGYVDANMLARLVPAGVVGWYGAATSFSNTLIAPAFVLASAAYPGLSVAAGDPREFGRILRAALRPLLFVAVLGAVGTYLFADVAVGLVYSTQKFGPSASILRAFTPAMVLVYLDMMLGTAILARGRALPLAGAKLVSVVVITGTELFLIPYCQARFGNGGIAVMLSFAIGELVMVAAAIRLLGGGTLDRRIVLDLARAFAAGAATLAIVQWPGRMSPLLGIPFCVAVFSLAALVVGLVTRADVRSLAGLVTRRAARPAPRRGALHDSAPVLANQESV
jgi:PST family polysaccharide transporter